MKASEVMSPGFYWYRDSVHPWAVCHIDGDTFFYGCGSDEFEDFPLAAGVLPEETEFVGPIEPPGAASDASPPTDEELVRLAAAAGFDTGFPAQFTGVSGKSAFDEQIYVANEYPVGERLRRFAALLMQGKRQPNS